MKRYPISSVLVSGKLGPGTAVIEAFDNEKRTPIEVALPSTVQAAPPRSTDFVAGSTRTRVFKTYVEHLAAAPDHEGQLGVQLSTGVLYIGNSTDVGDWIPWAVPEIR